MKQASLNLPFINMTIANGIQAGSLTSLAQQPDGVVGFTSTTGKKAEFYMFVNAGEQPLSNFDADVIPGLIAAEFLKVVKENDLFEDGISLVNIEDNPWLDGDDNPTQAWINLTAEQRREENEKEWIDNAGRAYAKEVIQHIPADDAATSIDTYVLFNSAIADMNVGDNAAAIRMTIPKHGKLEIDILKGNIPQPAELDIDSIVNAESVEDFLGGLIKAIGGSGRRRGGCICGKCKNKTAYVNVPFVVNGNDFTAVFPLSFGLESAAWFADGALAEIAKQGLSLGLSKLSDQFGEVGGGCRSLSNTGIINLIRHSGDSAMPDQSLMLLNFSPQSKIYRKWCKITAILHSTTSLSNLVHCFFFDRKYHARSIFTRLSSSLWR